MTILLRPPTSADGQLLLTLSQRDELVTPGSSESAVLNDANVLSITPSVTDTAWDISASAVHFSRQVDVVLSSSATGSISGRRLTRVSDGACTVLAKSGMFIERVDVSMLRQSGQTVNEWQSWVTGSLAADIDQTTNVSLPFWRGTGYGFTAISPRHVIGCEHIAYMPPTLTLGGVTRSLVSSAYVGSSNSADAWKSDLLVGRYDGDFPSFAKVFPSTLFSYLPSLALKGVHVILGNHHGQKLQRMTSTFTSSVSKFSLTKINTSDTDIIGGDSGNPAFIVVDGEPVLLGTLTYGGAGSVTTIHDQITAINAAMTTLGGGYQLTTIDLSGYPAYS